MASLKDIRNRIKSVKSIQQVTSAMKMVAGAKMRKAQERMEQARPYAYRIRDVIEELLPDVDRGTLDLLEVRPIERVALVVLTSDRGLAGSFNSNIIKRTLQEMESLGRERTDLFCIGKKGADFFRKRNYRVVESHTDFWNQLNFNHAVKIGNGIVSHFLTGEVDEIRVIFNEFKNVATQIIRVERVLPLKFEPGERRAPRDRIYEPSKAAIVRSLVPRHLNVQIWRYLLESFASEQAARMVAMENATDNANEMIKSLQLEYNKARQNAITKEMLEIVSGAEALKQ
ncbi:MAG: ATP synthase F1 subunit gamma [Candidatus Neomarinimicrobiota bacterium]|nr:MAG: ATP synthase F1 subunit gamma [Candidatus Neomarinimicrobiota bacterium]